MKEPSYVPDDITTLLSSHLELILNTNVIILDSSSFADEATKIMKERNVHSVLASHNGEVIGIVSKTDILFKVMSQGRNPSKVPTTRNYDKSCNCGGIRNPLSKKHFL